MTILDVVLIIIKAIFVAAFAIGMFPLMVWVERKGSALIQDRIGPNRASIGFIRLGGLIHIVADAVKMFFKEDIIPTSANKFYYFLAPFIAVAVGLMTFITVPFADTLKLGEKIIHMQVLNIDAGLLWFFAIVSLSVYGIVFAGWSSNSKYSLLGGLRASAQMLSYEIPMVLSVIGIIMISGTVHLNEIVLQQGELLWGFLPKWGIVVQPLAAIIFIICAFAEANRTPFDLPEGESELVGGFHTEYSSMKFGMFFMAEYVSMVVSSGIIVTLFFGGWQVPFFNTEALIEYSKILSQIGFGFFGVLCLVLGYKLFSYFENTKHRWKDARDYESLIFSLLSIFTGIFLLGVLVLVSVINLPEWYAPVFAFLAQLVTFLLKVFIMCFVFVWVRWTVPRFRYDQIMSLGWKNLLPLALVNIFITGVLILFLG